MSPTVLAIDPDVWRASASDPRCYTAIWDVWVNPEKIDSYAVALDGGEIESEYVELLAASSTATELRKILQDIFNQRERSQRVQIIYPHLTDELRQEISRRHCETPVEPALIGMAASFSGSNLNLVLVGTDTVRHRGLHDKGVQKSLRTFFRRKLRKTFNVKVTSAFSLIGRSEEIDAYQRREFENQARLIMMQRVYQKFSAMPCFERITPGQVFNYLDESGRKAGEVDGYLFLDTDEVRHVWIGECELRDEGNEGQSTLDTKMMKLARRVEAANSFERGRTKNTVATKGYLITNADAMIPGASAVAQANNLQFVSVRMPDDWTTNLHWTLREQDFPYCDL